MTDRKPRTAILRGLNDIASYIGVHPRTARSYIDQGMPATLIGTAWLTSPHLIDQWILSRHPADISASRQRRRLTKLKRAAEQRALYG